MIGSVGVVAPGPGSRVSATVALAPSRRGLIALGRWPARRWRRCS